MWPSLLGFLLGLLFVSAALWAVRLHERGKAYWLRNAGLVDLYVLTIERANERLPVSVRAEVLGVGRARNLLLLAQAGRGGLCIAF